MFFVRAQTTGVWSSVDICDRAGNKMGEKRLIMAKVQGPWCVDHRRIDVVPGLCISAVNHADAQWFLDQDNACLVQVEPETVVMFADEGDALFYVRAGLGEMMGQREVDDMFAAVRAAQEAEGAQAEDGEQGDQGGPAQEADRAARKRGRSRKAA